MHKRNKLHQLINCRVCVVFNDGRTFSGQLLAFDKFLNIVLADCDEKRVAGKGDAQKTFSRSLGMLLLRGDTIVSISAEVVKPLSSQNKARVPASLQVPSAASLAATAAHDSRSGV